MTQQGPEVAGARYPREPNVDPGGEQEPGGGDRPLPPYDDKDLPGQPGRQMTGKSNEQLIQERGGTGKSDVGSREVSQEEREGMEVTDIKPKVQHNVGESVSTSGEDLMRGTSEEARREHRLDQGLSDVDSKATDSPATSSGDQGG